jgi:hypothetical protein
LSSACFSFLKAFEFTGAELLDLFSVSIRDSSGNDFKPNLIDEETSTE